MPTTRREVTAALKAMIQRAVPLAVVAGFDQETATAKAVGPGGLVIGFPGDRGEPQIDLSPRLYRWDHGFPLEVTPSLDSVDMDAALAIMLTEIGGAIEADPTLGGLCDWIEAGAAEIDDSAEEDAPPIRFAAVTITASYATLTPLS